MKKKPAMHKKREAFLRQIGDRIDRLAVFFHGEIQVAAFFTVVFGWCGNVANDGAFGDGVACRLGIDSGGQ